MFFKEIIKFWLPKWMQNGANVNKLTKNGFCPLRTAAQENHVAIAESLIRHGAD